ncbi:hypothetical protein NQZ68_020853 [Dissostichus eleginoides]|nr:hypothetical protein NQZ68_020853 [Dissostichus eleginoides]
MDGRIGRKEEGVSCGRDGRIGREEEGVSCGRDGRIGREEEGVSCGRDGRFGREEEGVSCGRVLEERMRHGEQQLVILCRASSLGSILLILTISVDKGQPLPEDAWGKNNLVTM